MHITMDSQQLELRLLKPQRQQLVLGLLNLTITNQRLTTSHNHITTPWLQIKARIRCILHLHHQRIIRITTITIIILALESTRPTSRTTITATITHRTQIKPFIIRIQECTRLRPIQGRTDGTPCTPHPWLMLRPLYFHRRHTFRSTVAEEEMAPEVHSVQFPVATATKCCR